MGCRRCSCKSGHTREHKHDALVALAERILAAKRTDSAADTSALEREIDDRVFHLYALTPEEIGLVQGGTP